MGRFANMAEEHWRLHLTADYERIADKAAFFADVEEVAMDQLEDLEERFRGQDPPGESFADRAARFARARASAEEIVVREVVVIGPSSPTVDVAPVPDDTEYEDAVNDFNRLHDELRASLDQESEVRHEDSTPAPVGPSGMEP